MVLLTQVNNELQEGERDYALVCVLCVVCAHVAGKMLATLLEYHNKYSPNVKTDLTMEVILDC